MNSKNQSKLVWMKSHRNWSDGPRAPGSEFRRSFSRNNPTGFIGGLGTSRWQIYHPESEQLDNALNLRPIGNAKVRFNIHQDGDLDWMTTHLD